MLLFCSVLASYSHGIVYLSGLPFRSQRLISARERRDVGLHIGDTLLQCKENYPGLLELETDVFNTFFRGGPENHILKQDNEFYSEFFSLGIRRSPGNGIARF